MSKRELGLFLAAFVLLTAGFLFSLDTREQQIYPYRADSGNAYYVAHEGVEKDWSQVSDYSGKDGYLYFRYTLSKALAEPFVALYLHKVVGPDLHFDFSGFDEIRIRLKSQKGKRIPVYLTVDNRNFHPKSEVFLSMPLVKVIDYDGEREYRLHKKDFEIPSWWLRYHGLKSEDVGKVDYSKVDYIMINSCQTLQPGDSDEIGVGSIVFAHSHAWNYRIYGALSLLLIGALCLRIFLLKRGDAEQGAEIRILVPYKAKEVESSRSGVKTERIVHYIAEHYAEPGLSVTHMEKALGISAREIGSLMRKEFDSSFKSYLNRIRLTEIKRLLVETDLSVSDIAYRTGYNNIPHFNRIFKAEVGMSPKEFRMQQAESPPA